jgi:hypothetical protein
MSQGETVVERADDDQDGGAGQAENECAISMIEGEACSQQAGEYGNAADGRDGSAVDLAALTRMIDEADLGSQRVNNLESDGSDKEREYRFHDGPHNSPYGLAW